MRQPIITNVKVYGLDESIAASKYPFATDPSACTSDVTKTVKKLGAAKMGSGEDTYLQGIIAQFDLTLPLKVWVEAQRYHFLDFVSSMSTMHCITKLDVDEQCNEYVFHTTVELLKRYIDDYNKNPSEELFKRIIYNIPSGFCYTARMTTNYRQLKTIYHQRRMHRLEPWREFCEAVEQFPMFKELVLGEE